MAKKVVEGHCHVCGTYGPLSEEHVPPKRAFNTIRYIEVRGQDKFNLGPEDVPSGPKRQGGVRFPTLCRQCNNDFGSWYAPAFARWCYEGMTILDRSGGSPRLVYAHHVHPLRIIKQIIAMFFSVNSNEFRLTDRGKDLAWLLRNPAEKGLPPGVRFYAYFNYTGQLRYNSVSALMNIYEDITYVFSEITFPPYGYVMTMDSDPPNPRMFDITHFAWFDLDDERAMFLDLPVLPTYLAGIPGDYRTLDEIYYQRYKSKIDATVARLQRARLAHG